MLRPDLRATGRAALDRLTGIVGALAMTLSGQLVASQGGDIITLLLLMISIPKMLAALLWLPIFHTYSTDRLICEACCSSGARRFQGGNFAEPRRWSGSPSFCRPDMIDGK